MLRAMYSSQATRLLVPSLNAQQKFSVIGGNFPPQFLASAVKHLNFDGLAGFRNIQFCWVFLYIVMCSMGYGRRFEIYAETVLNLIGKLEKFKVLFHSSNENALKL